MNAQERELLTSFLDQMVQAQAGPKDMEAETLIRNAAARQPDALYLLVQRAMQLDYALKATQAEAAKLQSELDQARGDSRSGFLTNPKAWGRGAPAAAPSASAVATAQPRPQSATAAPQAPASSWGSGMLGNVATTAAGVVAGSFLFQGIQGLMGHHNQAANALSPHSLDSVAGNDYDNNPPRNDALDDVASADDTDYADFSDSGDSLDSA